MSEFVTTPPLYKVEYFPGSERPSSAVLSHYATRNANMRDQLVEHAPDWRSHIFNSKVSIMKAAEGLSGSALVLGYGNGMEIPLPQLADQFDKVTVVELDEQAARLGLEALSPDQQAKCTLMVDDLTAGVKRADERLMRVVKSSKNPTEFILETNRVTNSLPARHLKIPGQFDFVVSSLVMTQLGILMVEPSEAAFNERFSPHSSYKPGELPSKKEMEMHTIANSDLSKRLQMEHLTMLTENTKPGGRLYLSDTTSKRELTRTLANPRQVVAGEFLPMSDFQAVLEILSQNFSASESANWWWINEPPLAPTTKPTTGNAFYVDAVRLDRKNANPSV